MLQLFKKGDLDHIPLNKTPFYLYDLDLLRKTIKTCKTEAENFHIHYAIKANSNSEVLKTIKQFDLGIDCVSINEVKTAINANFTPNNIVFAGVGKTDYEIKEAIKHKILTLNVESLQEITIVNELAKQLGAVSPICLRINPNIDAYTHKHITTGLEGNKFGINLHDINEAIDIVKQSKNIKFMGLHFHIGSQITNLDIFKQLCYKVNDLTKYFAEKQLNCTIINMGGGLGVDYLEPELNQISNFKDYFSIFRKELHYDASKQKVIFELGRSIVAQSGSLITKVLFIKKTGDILTAIVDAGMTELLRPSLYNAYHKISLVEKLPSNSTAKHSYNIVGPICESSDYFAKNVRLIELKRNDILIIHSTGAYGESMSLNYNLRDKPTSFYIGL